MSTKYLLTIILIFFLSACATGPGDNISDPNASMVIIGAESLAMDPDGHVYERQQQFVEQLGLKNMATGIIYPVPLGFNHGIATVPAGTYCIDNLDGLQYCGQPLFELKPGVVLNAGYFVFAVNRRNGKYKLYKAGVYGDELMSTQTKDQLKAIQRFKDAHPVTAVQAP